MRAARRDPARKLSENTTTQEKWFLKKKSITKKELKALVNIIILLVAVTVYFGMKFIPQQKVGAVKDGSSFYITNAVDGDTLKLSSGDRVRLIGIDTPESRYNAKLARDSGRSGKDINTIIAMGKEAAKFTKGLVQHKRARLEFDVEKKDKYGRLLAYVRLEDGTFVNARIVEEGYAQVLTIPPNVKYADLFLKLQREAREKKKGLWRDNNASNLF